MKHQIHLILLLVGVVFCLALPVEAQDKKADAAFNQKSTLRELKQLRKDANFSRIEQMTGQLLKQHGAAALGPRILQYAVEAQARLVEQENTKIFLNNRADTAAYFRHILQLYNQALLADSVDCLPNADGRIKPTLSRYLGEQTSALRTNLLSGGKFFYKKRDFATSYSFFHVFLSTTHYQFGRVENAKRMVRIASVEADADSLEVAQLASISAFSAKRYTDALTHISTALLDTANRSFMLELAAKSYQALNRKEAYMETLKQGFAAYPAYDYFYSSLLASYDEAHDFAQADSLLRRLISLFPNNSKYYYLHGRLLQADSQYEPAISAFTHARDNMPPDSLNTVSFATVSAALGSAYLDSAHLFFDQADLKISSPNYATNRKTLNGFYEAARLAYEDARSAAPTQTQLWLRELREIYFKLNRGKELKALERLKL